MWTTKTKILQILYIIFGAKLPTSQHSAVAKHIRNFWAKKIVAQYGYNINIERNAIFSPELKIGDNSGIGINCEIYGPVTIGNDVMMGPNVVIYTSSHKYDRTDVPMRRQGRGEPQPVEIGNDVWIGRDVTIMPGVKVGNGCIIGASAVVTKDIPDYSIAVGVPAKVVKNRLQYVLSD